MCPMPLANGHEPVTRYPPSTAIARELVPGGPEATTASGGPKTSCTTGGTKYPAARDDPDAWAMHHAVLASALAISSTA